MKRVPENRVRAAFKAVVFLAAAVLLAMPIASCKSRQSTIPAGSRVLARIGDQPITVEEFALEWNMVRGARHGLPPLDESTSRRLKRDLLNRIMDQKLVLEAAKGKVAVTDDEVAAELHEMHSGYSEDQFNEAMLDSFLTQDALQKRVRERLVAERFRQTQIADKAGATGEEAARYFLDHKQEFERPDKVRVLHIVTKTEEEMEQVLDHLSKGGMDFATIARKYSAGPEAASGGELPIYSADQMPDVFRAAFDLKEGEVSGVLSSPYGYHLIKLVKMYPGREVTFDDAADEARLKVLEAKKREAVAAWTARARAAASSWMDEKLLDSIP